MGEDHMAAATIRNKPTATHAIMNTIAIPINLVNAANARDIHSR
jgi:hypothetical protein